MQINWDHVLKIAVSIIIVFIGKVLDNFLRRRPILIAHYGHASGFASRTTNGEPFNVNTHSVIIRNVGKKSANNVRVTHNYLPEISVYPSVQYDINDVPDGGKEILFPILTPKEEITINYLYFPPVTVAQILTSVKADEGAAKIINVWLAPLPSKLFLFTTSYLWFAGLIATVYFVINFILYLRSW